MQVRTLLLFITSFLTLQIFAQKKPLDHSDFDQWQSVITRSISNDGKWVLYQVNEQEGDGVLVIQSTDGSYKKVIDRGGAPTITEDSRHVIFRVRPHYDSTRQARIKKKRPDEMPKDTLVLMELGKDSLFRITKFKSFKLPEKSGEWFAYHLEKAAPAADTSSRNRRQPPQANPVVDSLKRVIDSLINVINTTPPAKKKKKRDDLAEDLVFLYDKIESAGDNAWAPDPPRTVVEGTDLILRNLKTGESKTIKYVNEYYFSKDGNVLLLEISPNTKDTSSQLSVVIMDLATGNQKTIYKGGNDFKSFTMDDSGKQVAFIVEKDSSAKALQKFYGLYHYKEGMETAVLKADRFTKGMQPGFTVSESGRIQFSKDGQRLFFGVSEIRPPKDTTLVEFETAKLDIWHYNDDFLQPQQLKQLNSELNRSYTALVKDDGLVMLGSPDLESIQLINEGNSNYVVGSTTKGSRKESQWIGRALTTYYLVNIENGAKKLIKEKFRSAVGASPNGKYLYWYDPATRHYFSYDIASGTVKNITSKIKVPLYDDEDDHPDDPPSFRDAGWLDDDSYVLINDRYDIWKVDPTGVQAPVNITNGFGRKNKIVLRMLNFERGEKRTISPDAEMVFSAFARTDKQSGYFRKKLNAAGDPEKLTMGPYNHSSLTKAKEAEVYVLSRSNIKESPDVYVTTDLKNFKQFSFINPQQKDYNWLTVELVKWKMFDGKMSEGLLFKPEDFDPKKKYPVIFYFYEKDSDELHNYRFPGPSASTINIPYFVSNGYIVFNPNIHYKNGEPGESAYNSVVSAAKYLAKMPWVDSTKMGIQGQSWGGYQVAYLVTRTNMFAAAGAGAPVANMTSAYGGIRWGSGMSRQFQYERTQSRLGATLWERPDLYIKNSPLFKADKVNTPLLLMHNDQDGAVPWYQSIEYFTALRRLGKKVWLLQYNGEDHNLVERRNRKDLGIRLAQFFDHFLKGKPAPQWIETGVPATQKGITWGL